MKKATSLPFSGVKKNSSFMIDVDLERLAKDYALLKRMSYSAFVESLIREKVSPYSESLKEFFNTPLKPGIPDGHIEMKIKSNKEYQRDMFYKAIDPNLPQAQKDEMLKQYDKLINTMPKKVEPFKKVSKSKGKPKK